MDEKDENARDKWKWAHMPKGSGIFAIQNKSSGKAYFVGVRDMKKRSKLHHELLVRGSHHNPALQAAWNEDPSDFEFRVVEIVRAVQFLNVFKQAHISRSTSCYNRKNAVPIEQH